MEIHAPAAALLDTMISDVKTRSAQEKQAVPFQDPLREFQSASRLAGMAYQWLTLSVDERKKKLTMLEYRGRYLGDPDRKVEPESQRAFEIRCMERWRTLMVIIQEETRALMEPTKYVHSAEVAIAALKLAMPDHPWNKGK